MQAEDMDILLDAVDRFPCGRSLLTASLDHPDPVPLLYLLEEGVANPDVGMVILGWLIWCAKEYMLTRNKVSSTAVVNLRRGLLNDRVNPEAPGWTKRLWLGSSPPDRVPCLSRMSALELSTRKYAEQPDKSVVRPELGLSFDSLGEANDFYNLYSWD